MPAARTRISVVAHTTVSSTRAERVRAILRSSGCTRARRRVVAQRLQRATVPGFNSGTTWNSPHPEHSRKDAFRQSIVIRYHSGSGRRHRVVGRAVSMVASPSANWPSAALMAVTSAVVSAADVGMA